MGGGGGTLEFGTAAGMDGAGGAFGAAGGGFIAICGGGGTAGAATFGGGAIFGTSGMGGDTGFATDGCGGGAGLAFGRGATGVCGGAGSGIFFAICAGGIDVSGGGGGGVRGRGVAMGGAGGGVDRRGAGRVRGVDRLASPCGSDNCDFGATAGGGNRPLLSAGAVVVGVRPPDRSMPGKVGSGPSLSRTLRSTMTLGRLDPCG